jgi:GMP synthase (glutamine-hydrolysing)
MYIPVVFMGGQYNHLIVRALKELGVESRLITPNMKVAALKEIDGLIVGGGPHSVNDGMDKFGSAPQIIEGAGFPILGICLSHQLIGKLLGGNVVKGRKPEYGKTVIQVIEPDDILQGVGKEFVAWASHNDEVRKDGGRFSVLARSIYCEVEALKGNGRPIYGVQFHIEVSDTPKGKTILKNFINLCRG